MVDINESGVRWHKNKQPLTGLHEHYYNMTASGFESNDEKNYWNSASFSKFDSSSWKFDLG